MNFISPFLIGIGLGINLMGLGLNLADITYKDGQIDAIQGKIHYQLVPQKDGTTEWEYVK